MLLPVDNLCMLLPPALQKGSMCSVILWPSQRRQSSMKLVSLELVSLRCLAVVCLYDGGAGVAHTYHRYDTAYLEDVVS